MRPQRVKDRSVKRLVLLIAIMLVSIMSVFAENSTQGLNLTNEETKWLEAHHDEIFILGLDPYSGMDYFTYYDASKGYVVDFADLIEETTGLQIEIMGDKSWSEVYQGLQDQTIDILFGANVTEDRLRFMRFTEPIHKYPYAMLALDESTVMSIGDIDKKSLGFIEDDIAIDLIPQTYSRIQYNQSIFPSQQVAVDALLRGEIDAFITNGGSVVDHFLYTYPQLKVVAEFDTITSDMTLSTLKENDVLINIIDQVIKSHRVEIENMIAKAYYEYNWLILDLSKEEVAYISALKEPVKVAVSSDYLPFEYIEGDTPDGIFVAYFNQLSQVVGIPFEFVAGDFNQLYSDLESNEIQAMNLAKTEERKSKLLFTNPFSTERDIIFGYKESAYVGDIYGLENKRVAVVDGYYQKAYLEKNLNHVEWIITENIVDALQLINDEKADYIIENPTVVQYYIDELKLYNISKKGDTSSDSQLYIALNGENAILGSVINKAMVVMDYDAIKNDALNKVPHIAGDAVARLGMVIIGLAFLILIVIIILIRISKKLINEKTKSKLLEERQKLLYLDPMTELKNRQYYNMVETELDKIPFPQVYVVADLNNLKSVNDTHGHFVGDEYIIRFSSILKKELPEKCLVIRMGGDEFLIIIEACTYEEGKAYIEGINEACNLDEFYKALKMSYSWVSFGLQERFDAKLSVTDAIQKADNYMYANKKKAKELVK